MRELNQVELFEVSGGGEGAKCAPTGGNPVGGAAAGAVAGALAGSLAGPLGAVAGAIAGAVAGAVGGMVVDAVDINNCLKKE